MITAADFSRLSPADKAQLIYAQAQADVSTRLWRAALGSGEDNGDAGATGTSTVPGFTLDSLLSLLMPKNTAGGVPSAATPATPASPDLLTLSKVTPPPGIASALDPLMIGRTGAEGPVTGLGPNARYRSVLDSAAERTGIPAPALAAIVNAEAAKAGDGGWKTGSRNPRSSAAGLGQFLSGTWEGEAERPGTWLNATAARQGWLSGDGKILPAARSALLALRYDASASINATADYASRSLAQLKQAGIAIGDDMDAVARAAYIGHHLGVGDAIRFLKGGLDSGRATVLLKAQIGSASASARIMRAGDAATAHRSWLLDFVSRNVTPARFAS